jgi:large subunit ribosomal protein L35Ae
MEGLIINFRRARHHTSHTHMIVAVKGVDSKAEAEKLIGKSVVWESSAKTQIGGKVAAAHGGNGALRVIFERGMPGQSIGSKVLIN